MAHIAEHLRMSLCMCMHTYIHMYIYTYIYVLYSGVYICIVRTHTPKKFHVQESTCAV